MKYAGFWIRFLAAFLDNIILLPALVIIYALLLTVAKGVFSGLALLLEPAIMIYMVGKYGGGPGKLLLGLRIIDVNNKKVGYSQAALRYLGEIINGFTLHIGYLLIIWDKRKQGLHDKIANTAVVEHSTLKKQG